MAFKIPYSGKTITIPDTVIPGNEKDPIPVQLDIVPAWGADRARIKSMIYAGLGLISDQWSPDVQDAVIKSFEHAGGVFTTCVKAVRGITVPAAAAYRAGLLPVEPAADAPDVPILTGREFAAVSGAMIGIAYTTAMEIAAISDEVGKATDRRFLARPSGSSGRGTTKKGKGLDVKTARPAPSAAGTAGSDSTAKAG